MFTLNLPALKMITYNPQHERYLFYDKQRIRDVSLLDSSVITLAPIENVKLYFIMHLHLKTRFPEYGLLFFHVGRFFTLK